MLGGTVRGATTRLRLPTVDDLPSYQRWSADLRARAGGPMGRIDEPAMQATWKERLIEWEKEKETVVWSIEAESSLIGMAAVQFSGAPAADTMDVNRLVIDPDHWRSGYGWDAALTLHRWIFDVCHLRAADLELPADNVAGLRIAAKLGYERYALGHAVYYRDGRWLDQHRMRMDLDAWDAGWGKTQREYATPLGAELEH
jgi:RimJ/RimL family protein N-acetyltransferase